MQTMQTLERTNPMQKDANPMHEDVRSDRYLSHLGGARYKPYAQGGKTGRAREEKYVIGVHPT